MAKPEYLEIILAFLFGAIFTYIIFQIRLSRLKTNNTELATRLELETQNIKKKIESLEKVNQQMKEQLNESFSSLSSAALKSNNEAFLKLLQ